MRCVGAWLRDTERVAPRGIVRRRDAGRDRATCGSTLDGATVAMGQPNFTKAAIPMRGPAWETFQDQPFDAGDGRTMRATALSMGNPHLVLFTDEDPERYHLEHMGPALEHHELFPERTNVEFARVAGDGVIDVRVWERGVGETLACGTGACAVAVAANEAGHGARGGRSCGSAEGRCTSNGAATARCCLGGPVQHVFDGVVDLDELDGMTERASGARRRHARAGGDRVGEP